MAIFLLVSRFLKVCRVYGSVKMERFKGFSIYMKIVPMREMRKFSQQNHILLRKRVACIEFENNNTFEKPITFINKC